MLSGMQQAPASCQCWAAAAAGPRHTGQTPPPQAVQQKAALLHPTPSTHSTPHHHPLGTHQVCDGLAQRCLHQVLVQQAGDARVGEDVSVAQAQVAAREGPVLRGEQGGTNDEQEQSAGGILPPGGRAGRASAA